jgi:hypothetical protein
MASRKRRRSAAFPEDVMNEEPVLVVDSSEGEEVSQAKPQKEQEMWEVFREEYYEGWSNILCLIVVSERVHSHRATTVDTAPTVQFVEGVGRSGQRCAYIPLVVAHSLIQLVKSITQTSSQLF